MDNRIKLQAGCMLIILFMAIIYFRTKRVKSYSHILFSISLGTMIFNLCFDTGFVIDGFYEECYFNKEIPDIIIVRAIKIER